MHQLLIIPDRKQLKDCLKLAKEYGLGFEYNDFFAPAVLDDDKKIAEIIDDYKRYELPEYTTVHGAFFDVIPFSEDVKIRKVAELRIEQSIRAAKGIGAKAVIFHTNYNSFLNTSDYINTWVENNAAYWSSVLEQHPDINIYLENMFDTTPDILEALSEKLCGYENYGVCLDYAHAVLSKVEPNEWAKRLGRFVKHIHVNDNDQQSDLHLAWGDGTINREDFYESIREYMKDVTILIETSSMESKVRSLEMLKKEGFLKNQMRYRES